MLEKETNLQFHEFYILFVESVGPNRQKFLLLHEFCVAETKPGKGKTLMCFGYYYYFF